MRIPPDFILPELQATERYPAIRELLQFLIKNTAIPSSAEDTIFSAFCEREKAMSTGIGFGLAFPHIASELVQQQIVVLGRSSAGINFFALDGKPVKEVYLMIFPASDTHAEKYA